MGEGSDRHELEERRAALRRLLPVVERLRGLDGVTWAGGQRHRNGVYLVRYPTYDEDTLGSLKIDMVFAPGTRVATDYAGDATSSSVSDHDPLRGAFTASG